MLWARQLPVLLLAAGGRHSPLLPPLLLQLALQRPLVPGQVAAGLAAAAGAAVHPWVMLALGTAAAVLRRQRDSTAAPAGRHQQEPPPLLLLLRAQMPGLQEEEGQRHQHQLSPASAPAVPGASLLSPQGLASWGSLSLPQSGSHPLGGCAAAAHTQHTTDSHVSKPAGTSCPARQLLTQRRQGRLCKRGYLPPHPESNTM